MFPVYHPSLSIRPRIPREEVVKPNVVPKRRAQSEDRPSSVRTSYVDATTSNQRGRSVKKIENDAGLKRRPSLNKQMRKKFESMIGTGSGKNKLCDDIELLERIRKLPAKLKGTEFNIKVRHRFDL